VPQFSRESHPFKEGGFFSSRGILNETSLNGTTAAEALTCKPYFQNIMAMVWQPLFNASLNNLSRHKVEGA
jgi:hypothetical protein